MGVSLCVLILAACALADNSQDRRYKLPFIADAVGNTLPPPSNVPATVGSPVNLLTPDRYEFYTFDESGELVKRLMTLEEIQAIVAAGEETEGLVTFANDNQPTIAFNFSQPPYTKVHSVVTNVQNVLKAQMEAHKNKPQTQPPLDTPDVSDSWSLILPSIFGNTGVDIVPDKGSGSFITPETETIELDTSNFEDENSLGKEGTNLIVSSSTTEAYSKTEKIPLSDKMPDKTMIPATSTTTTRKPTSTVKSTTAPKRRVPSSTTTTTTAKPRTTTNYSTFRPRTTTTTTSTSTTTTTYKPRSTTTSTTFRPRTTTTTTTTTTTAKPKIPTSSTTVRPTSAVTTTPKPKPIATTSRPQRTTSILFRRTTSSPISLSSEKSTTSVVSTRKPSTTTSKSSSLNDSSEVPNTIPLEFGAVLDTRKPVQYEKISTFVPISTITYVGDKSTKRPLITTKVTPTTVKHTTISSTMSESKDQQTTNRPYSSTNSYLTASASEQEYDKINSTTITTQSVSPSTTVSSTEFITINNQQTDAKGENIAHNDNNSHNEKENEPVLPLFDVAQSMSQIASDLGSSYAPLPTTANILDSTKVNNMEVESKENIEIEIPNDGENAQKNSNNSSSDNFVKISTLDPQQKNDNKSNTNDVVENDDIEKMTIQKQSSSTSTTTMSSTSTTTTSTTTTIDPILSESMEDLLSQVVHSAPETIVNEKHEILKDDNSHLTIEKDEHQQEEIESSVKVNKVESQTHNIMSTVNEGNDIPLTLNDTNDIEVYQKKKIGNNMNETKNTDQSIIVDFKDKKPNNDSLESSNNPVKIESSNEYFEQKNATQESNIQNENDIAKAVFSTTINDKELSVSSTESMPKLQSTTVTLGSTSTRQDENVPPTLEKNKIPGSSEKNQVTSINQNEKESVVFPKVDEFKKKIQKVNIDDKEFASESNNSWKLISTVSPPKAGDGGKDKHKNDDTNNPEINYDKNIILDFSKENQGLEVTTKDLGEDIAQFTELCNELAFQYWSSIAKDIDKKRSFVLSPYSITSMLAMMFMGARGSTSGEMNEILKLDDMVTFNPHFTLKNISDSIETSSGSGVAVSAFIRELYSDRSKGKILTFYKERAQHFYNGHVEEINFKLISDVIRRRTNLLVKRYTWGKIIEYMKTNTITMHPPLAAFSANIFQTDCSSSSVEGRDGEMYFVVSPNVRQRRLVPVPAVVYRSNFLAGYDPVLDATAAALGNTNSIISTLFLMPGQQGNIVHAEDLEALEKRLLESSPTTPAWNRLLRTLLPRVGLELQIPRFSHKSIFNVSSTLRRMGLKDLFDPDHADLAGLNGPSKDLYLSDMIQTTTFVTCGEGVISEQHHIEEYPETLESIQSRRTARWITGWDEPRDYQRAFHDPHDVGDAMHLPLHLRPRQARLPSRNAQPARLKFDRPFLFFVRHNPSGMILYVGRYNPRLLP